MHVIFRTVRRVCLLGLAMLALGVPDGRAEFGNRDMVKLVQAGLAELGYDPGPVDGVCGAKTEAAMGQYNQTSCPDVFSVALDLQKKLGAGLARGLGFEDITYRHVDAIRRDCLGYGYKLDDVATEYLGVAKDMVALFLEVNIGWFAWKADATKIGQAKEAYSCAIEVLRRKAKP